MFGFNKKRKTLFIIPFTIGALAFAAFGISNLVQAWQNPSSAKLAAGDTAIISTQNINGIHPDGGICNFLNCSACSGCHISKLTLMPQTDDARTVIAAESSHSY